MAYDPIIDFYDEPGGPNGGYKGGGSGGGGITLGKIVHIEASQESVIFSVSTTAYDISGDTCNEVRDSIYDSTNVCATESFYLEAPSGCHIAIETKVPSDWSADSVEVLVGEETASSDFECKKLYDDFSTYYYAYLTMQIPDDNLNVNFNLS